MVALGFFHEIVSYIEDEEILDPFNKFDLTALHYVYLILMATVMAQTLYVSNSLLSPIRLWVYAQVNSTSWT